MRERLAQILAALSAAIVVVLAAVFSMLHNAPGVAPGAVTQSESPGLAAGRAAYDRHGCAGCHAIGGQGNPRGPLDGVGRRRSPEALRDWIIASEGVRPNLSASVARMKQTYASLPAQELQALVDYLASLQAPGESR